MSANGDEDGRFSFESINRPKVSGNIDAPVVLPFTLKRMIVEEGMEWGV